MIRGSIKWYRSADWLDATTKLVRAENDFQFDKYTLDVSLNTTIDIFSTPFFYSSRVTTSPWRAGKVRLGTLAGIPY
jgi:hypothetical protein